MADATEQRTPKDGARLYLRIIATKGAMLNEGGAPDEPDATVRTAAK
jgi:hypothetical protein